MPAAARQGRAPGPEEGLEDGGTPNSVIGKVQAIVEAFGIDESALSLAEIARRTGIPKASVHRLIQELLTWGVIERSGSEYRLGLHLYELGSRVPLVRQLRDNVRPFMDDLHSQVGETVNLGVLAGFDVLFVDRASGYRQQPRPARLGGRVPLHCSSTGKVLMAFGPEYLLQHVLERPMPRLTRSTTTSKTRLIEAVNKAREDGYALDREEVATGFSGIAVPIFGEDGIAVGAMSIVGPTFRVNFSRFHQALTKTRARMDAAGALPKDLIKAINASK